MNYSCCKIYAGSGLKINIYSDRESYISKLEDYLLFSNYPDKQKPRFKINLYLSTQKHVLINNRDNLAAAKEAFFIDVIKKEIRVFVPQACKKHNSVFHNDVFIRPVSCLLNALGFYAIHASLVCKNRGYIFFPGPGGRGKSTFGCILALSGFKLLCDDMVFMNKANNRFALIPLRTLIKIDNKAKKAFIDLNSIVIKEMPIRSLDRELFLVFPHFCKNIKPRLNFISRKEGINRLISDNLVSDTGHANNGISQVSILDFICQLGKQAMFFEISYNDKNLIAAGELVKELCV